MVKLLSNAIMSPSGHTAPRRNGIHGTKYTTLRGDVQPPPGGASASGGLRDTSAEVGDPSGSMTSRVAEPTREVISIMYVGYWGIQKALQPSMVQALTLLAEREVASGNGAFRAGGPGFGPGPTGRRGQWLGQAV